MRISFEAIYELILAALLIFSLTVDLPPDQSQALDIFIYVLFVIDFSVRFFASDSKWQYIKSNPLELIAIIPLGEIFRAARLIRLLKILRLIVLFSRRHSLLDVFFSKYQVDRAVIIVGVLLFAASLSMRWIEPEFHTYEEALWWAVVTTTTVGYGDFYPVTTAGRIIASILMIVGIGLIGIITGTVAAFFSNDHRTLPPEARHVQETLNRYPELTTKEMDDMIASLEKWKKRYKKEEDQSS